MSGVFRFLLSVFIVLGLNTQAHAVSDQLLDGRALNVNSLAPTPVNCDSLCGIVVNDLTKDLKGLDGGGWSRNDDQWCANHSLGTNPTVLPSPVARPSGSPSPAPCNVAILYGDGSCEEVNRKMTHCKMHGSQLETQCLAYATTQDATKGEKVVLGFDIAATATCTTACVGQFAGPFGGAMIAACNIAGGSAAGAELIQTLRAKSSGVNKIISTLGASAAGVMTARAVGSQGLFGNGRGSSNHVATDQGKKLACVSATIYGALTGLRAFNISQHNKSKGKACEAVRDLVSNSFAPGFSVSTVSTTSTNTGNTTGGSSGSTVNTSTTGTSSGSTVRTSNTLLSDGGNYSGCVTSPSCSGRILDSASGNSSAATDAGLLKSSGLAKYLTNQAAALPMDQMMKHLENGGGADALIQSALGGQGGSFGSGVAALARAAQNDAASLGGIGGTAVAATPMGGGGMGGPGKAAAGEENPFKLMGQNEGNLGAQGDVGFAKPTELNGAEIGQDGDIYHASFSGSIFEIVSHKIKKTHDRVESVGWSLPMNRALAGQR